MYSQTGEKTEKHVYLPGDNYGKYEWANGAWILSDTIPNTWYFSGARYDKEVFNVSPTKVSYEIDDWRAVRYPTINGALVDIYTVNETFEPNYDANGNLKSLKVIYTAYPGYWEEYIVTYNAENKPVTIEKRDLYGKLLYEVNYEYNDFRRLCGMESVRQIKDRQTEGTCY
ncbi:MAG: hypothetical protein LBP64_00955 [Tannerella sp.]|nr:hypothetical protein [Tannerella sp.]